MSSSKITLEKTKDPVDDDGKAVCFPSREVAVQDLGPVERGGTATRGGLKRARGEQSRERGLAPGTRASSASARVSQCPRGASRFR